MLAQYKRLFNIPGGLRFSLSGFVLRLPISMLYLAIVLFIVAETDSYALAGALSMASSVVLAIATPLWSRAADQFGQSKILRITAPVHVIFLLLFINLVQKDAPTWTWFASALIFESFVIGSGQMVRRRWLHVIGEDRKLIDTAYSFEALVDETIFTSGPVIATIVASTISPAASIYVACSFVAIGALLFLREKDTEPAPHPKEVGEERSLLIRDRSIRALFLPLMLVGSFFSATGLVVVAYTDEYGVRNLSGLMIAIWSISSGIAAFISGTFHWKMGETRRFIIGVISLFLLTLPIYLAAHFFTGNLIIMAAVLFLNGLAIAPMLTAGLTVAERSVSQKRTTEVLAWTISALNLGGALPPAITGYIIDRFGSSVAFAIPVICMALSVSALLPYRAIWRAKLQPK